MVIEVKAAMGISHKEPGRKIKILEIAVNHGA